MTTTIVLEDGSEETYPRVRLDGGFVRCYERFEEPDRDDFDHILGYWCAWIKALQYSSYYLEKTIPQSSVEVIKE